MKTVEKQAGVKLHDGHYFTVKELADRYHCSESLINKRIRMNGLQPKMALGYQVYKDDPAMFLRKPKGPSKGTTGPDGGVRIGSYGEMFLIVQRLESAVKQMYEILVDLQTKQGEGNTLLLNVLTEPTKANPSPHQASLLGG